MSSPQTAAAAARRALRRMARPAGEFDASRYFRGAANLGFYNVGTGAVRELARSIHTAHARTWSVEDAVAFADTLIVDRFLEVKSLGIEVVARYRRELTPELLTTWKRWLADDHAANWATTDALCGYLIGPLIAESATLAALMRAWSRHRNMWVRRASAVSLIPSVRAGRSLDVAYAVARTLQPDREDLIQKAAGWLLREAGKANPSRLERYLRQNGPAIPRTTLRYAIERWPQKKRQEMLAKTKGKRQMAEGRRQKAKGRRQKEDGKLTAARGHAADGR